MVSERQAFLDHLATSARRENRQYRHEQIGKAAAMIVCMLGIVLITKIVGDILKYWGVL